ncbi:nucleotidyltransferase family protein [Alteromonas sp. 5E99-2]|uniref:nucleotidyltransferase family protein n=1 Tax=Alteromonas sp. 5E99-2 TaxID=2817683 RepID=UPI001A98882A|nr:nucleotidyltransferase family protein [Alteromonas sp. 5E99-2]MBO1254237.1 nucleotidyltransferase family protein [Alteromonas sp. 5E99-2]
MRTQSLKIYRYCLETDCTYITNDLVEFVIKTPELHRLGSILYNKIDTESISSNNASSLKKLATMCNIQNLKHTAFIQDFANRLESKNAKITLLKSSALNNYIYSKNTPRGNSDLDILLDDDSSGHVLTELNIIANEHTPKSTNPFDQLYEKTWISKQQPTTYIDAHFTLTNPFLVNIEHRELFDGSIKHPYYNSESIRCLQPEENLIHLALHVFTDGYYFHYSILDAALLIQKCDIDFNKMVELAQRWHCSRIVFFLLFLIERELKVSIPQEKMKMNHSFRYFVAKTIMMKKFKKQSVLRRCQQILCQYTLSDQFTSVIAIQLKYIISRIAYIFKIES